MIHRFLKSQIARIGLAILLVTFVNTSTAVSQNAVPEDLQFGVGVPPDVEQITQKALDFLVQTQNENGSWSGGVDRHAKGRENCGVVGLAVMAMLSTGEDPNSGPYAETIRAGLRYIILTQNPETGFLPTTMYNHGFGMLALSEAYGTIDEKLLWKDVEFDESRKRSLGESVKLAVELAVKSQEKNKLKAWRYTPTARDADTSVSGSVLVGLLAARNAGVAVPDQSLDGAFGYLESMTSRSSGETLYSGVRGSLSGSGNLSAISALTASIGQKKDNKNFAAAGDRVKEFIDLQDQTFPFYNMYYMAQALFQTDYEAWERWNRLTILRLRRQQDKDGSFSNNEGKAYATSMACLALALNYRLLPIYER